MENIKKMTSLKRLLALILAALMLLCMLPTPAAHADDFTVTFGDNEGKMTLTGESVQLVSSVTGAESFQITINGKETKTVTAVKESTVSQPGEYTVTVKNCVGGSPQEPEISKIITVKKDMGITATPVTGLVYNGNEQKLVNTENVPEGVTLSYKVGGEEKSEPKGQDAGNYSVEISAAETDDYWSWSETVKASIAQKPTTYTVNATKNENLIFNGEEQTLVTINSIVPSGDAPTEHSQTIKNEKAQNAGSYAISITITPTDSNFASYTEELGQVTIAGKTPELYISDGGGSLPKVLNSTLDNVTSNFKAGTSTDAEGEITFKIYTTDGVYFNEITDPDIAKCVRNVDAVGGWPNADVCIKQPGYYVFKALQAANGNYAEVNEYTKIENNKNAFFYTIKASEALPLIKFAEESRSYKLSTAVIPSQTAVKLYKTDTGTVTYSLNITDAGLSIDNATGTLSVDKTVLANKLFLNEDGSFKETITPINFVITASKGASGEYIPAKTDNYTIKVSAEKLNPEDVFEISGTEGENGWYQSDVTLTAKEGYLIGTSIDSFSASIVYSESKEAGYIYSKKTDNGTISIVPVREIKIDEDAPTIEEAKFEVDSAYVINSVVFFGQLMHQSKVKVDLAAVDNNSKVQKFEYELKNEIDNKSQTISGADIKTDDDGRSTASFEISGEDYLESKATLSIKVTDFAGNAKQVTDQKQIVYDNTSPVLSLVAPTVKDGQVEYAGKTYPAYKKNVVIDFVVDELNAEYYEKDEDGNVVYKNNSKDEFVTGFKYTLSKFNKTKGEYEEAPSKSGVTFIGAKGEENKYQFVMTLPLSLGDGLYKVWAQYRDPAGNIMQYAPANEYVYEFILDNTTPIATFEYRGHRGETGNVTVNADNPYSNGAVTATIELVEENFSNKDNFTVSYTANGSTTKIDSIQWTNVSDDKWIADVEIPAVDGNYVLEASYTDPAGNKMADYSSSSMFGEKGFIIDTTAPVISLTNDFSSQYYKEEQTSTINVEEVNFDPASTKVSLTATDSSGMEKTSVSDSVLPIVNTYFNMDNWTASGSTNSAATVFYCNGKNANYSGFVIDSTDLAGNKAVQYEVHDFSIDDELPVMCGKNPNAITADNSSDVKYKDGVNATIIEKEQEDFLSNILKFISFGFYQQQPEKLVKLSGTDETSGIGTFSYKYVSEKDVSTINEQTYAEFENATAEITHETGTNVYSTEFNLPEEKQYRGYLLAKAADNSGNAMEDTEAVYRYASALDGDGNEIITIDEIVIDTIAPTARVTYTSPVNVSGGKRYFDKDINFDLYVDEANFLEGTVDYANDNQTIQDLVVSVSTEGGTFTKQVKWDKSTDDTHHGTFSLSGDGEYTVTISYNDRSNNIMGTPVDWPSGILVIDTEIDDVEIEVNGEDGDGKAFNDDEIEVSVYFSDPNYAAYSCTLIRTVKGQKNVDVMKQFITASAFKPDEKGEGGVLEFEIPYTKENDGIYTFEFSYSDLAGHSAGDKCTFTVNRYGSVYEYGDYLSEIIKDGGQYIQYVEEELTVSEFNPDKLKAGSANVVITRDGKPIENVKWSVTPEINDKVKTGETGWYEYRYAIDPSNFEEDGVYKITISSSDATGNSSDNTVLDDIVFFVDHTAPEITSVSGLEKAIVNAESQDVRYSVFDAMGLAHIVVYKNGEIEEEEKLFEADANNWAGALTLLESNDYQNVRIIATDIAGNITDTADDNFVSAFVMQPKVIVSTNFFVRFYANKPLFFGTIGGVIAIAAIATTTTVALKKKKSDTRQHKER